MPCMSYGPVDDGSQTRAELDKVTRLLCETLRTLKRRDLDPEDYLSKEGKKWWKDHQEQDAKREAAEKAEAEREQLRKDALAKLTPAEKKALRLRFGS